MSKEYELAHDGDEDDTKYQCLVCESSARGLEESLAHHVQQHALNVKEILDEVAKQDVYQRVKLINYMRLQAKQKIEISEIINNIKQKDAWTAEEYLKPAIEDDALLVELIDVDSEDDSDWEVNADDDEEEDSEDETRAASQNIRNQVMRNIAAKSKQSASKPESHTDLAKENLALRSKVISLEETVKAMKDTVEHIIKTDKSVSRRRRPSISSSDDSSDSTSDSDSVSTLTERNPSIKSAMSPPPAPKENKSAAREEAGYFAGYSARYIHELMLKDAVRTNAYRQFIEENKPLFDGKVVLDIGCGTGILSLFAARTGAKVIAVDAAEIADSARKIVAVNGYSDRITVIKGKIEEVEIPEKCDIIISEWMGYFLLFESMLPSVLLARDRYLKKGGKVYPNSATMLIGGIECSEYRNAKVDYWRNVYGFDMSVLIDESERVGSGSSVEIVQAHQVITTEAVIKKIDCETVQDKELDFTENFEITFTENKTIDAFSVWFTTQFDGVNVTSPVILSTSPSQPQTHWMQSVFRLYHRIDGRVGWKVNGTIQANRMKRSPRSYSILFTYWATEITDGVQTEGQRYVQKFKIE